MRLVDHLLGFTEVLLQMYGYLDTNCCLLAVVFSYKLMMDDGQGGPLRKVFEGGATSYKALRLRPASSYRVAVQVHVLFYILGGEALGV